MIWQQELAAILESPTEPDRAGEQATVMASTRSLRVLIGPEGQSYKLRPGSLTLGRSKSCDIRVNDSAASREHATLEFDGQQCMVYDEGSANGTFINEKQVGLEGMPLNPGDRLRIGQAVFSLGTTMPEPGSPISPPPASQMVDESVETAHLPTRTAPIASTGEQPFPEEVPAPDSSSKSGGRLLPVAIVAVLLGVTGVVGYLTFGASLAPSPPAESNPATAPAVESNQEPAPTAAQAATVIATSAADTPEPALQPKPQPLRLFRLPTLRPAHLPCRQPLPRSRPDYLFRRAKVRLLCSIVLLMRSMSRSLQAMSSGH